MAYHYISYPIVLIINDEKFRMEDSKKRNGVFWIIQIFFSLHIFGTKTIRKTTTQQRSMISLLIVKFTEKSKRFHTCCFREFI